MRSTQSLTLATVLAATALSAETRTSRIAAGPQYDAGAFHRLTLGTSYRELWTTPIEVEELALETEAGGLEPLRRVGGQQTKGLALRGRDGRSYTFRSLDKDPASILPEELQDTFVEDLVQDQMAAQHPAAALVADELARAAGVATVAVRLVRLPDDPRLGELRGEFAGLLGTFSEYPTAGDDTHVGFQGASEVIDHLALYSRLAASPDQRVELREFLRARLLDLLISDFDRHRKQWRWARGKGEPLWHPIPEDRDQAFARYEGLLVRAAARRVPQLRTFGERYDSIHGLTYNGREQDRWLLPGLPHETWVEVARELQQRISDEAIERAARRMPREWYAIDGARLAASLRRRRDALPAEAERYYRHLAREVDVRGTDLPEEVRAQWLPGGALELEVSLRGTGEAPPPHFHRRFVPSETREVRLYLGGGADEVRVAGTPGSIRLRVIGGVGDDTLDDRGAGWTRLYDSEGENRLLAGRGTAWLRRPYRPPPGPARAPWIPPRDWGRDWFSLPRLGYGQDTGLFVGGGLTRVGYGFRRHPSASRQSWQAGWAFGAREPRLEYEGLFRREASRGGFGLLARYSGLELLRYHGYGNDSGGDENAEVYRVRHRQLLIRPTLSFYPTADLELTLAPLLQQTTTDEGEGRLLDLDRPYGTGSFGQLGGWLRLRLDRRRSLAAGAATPADGPATFGAMGYPTSGALVEGSAAVFPAAWDVERAYGWVEGSASGYLTAGARGRATLALRAGGRHLLAGDGATGTRYPFWSAAALGGGGILSGGDTLRGYHSTRFIGDSSLFGNAELRLYLSRFFVALPGEWGLVGFADAGRVWLRGESSSRWHPSWGGGVWVGLLSRSNAVAVTVARSEERTALSLRAGFSF